MSPRDTKTGNILEQMVLPALSQGGYTYETQVYIGSRPSGKRHRVDVLAKDKENREYLISTKWQQVPGTAEEKVPYEVISLAEVMKEGKYQKAYLVLGGAGWSLRDFYLTGGLDKHLIHSTYVKIVSLEEFIGLANRGEL